jgi:hypothetical protein
MDSAYRLKASVFNGLEWPTTEQVLKVDFLREHEHLVDVGALAGTCRTL